MPVRPAVLLQSRLLDHAFGCLLHICPLIPALLPILFYTLPSFYLSKLTFTLSRAFLDILDMLWSAYLKVIAAPCVSVRKNPATWGSAWVLSRVIATRSRIRRLIFLLLPFEGNRIYLLKLEANFIIISCFVRLFLFRSLGLHLVGNLSYRSLFFGSPLFDFVVCRLA